jgi:ABC-type phosphate transport system auxiliary subunit
MTILEKMKFSKDNAIDSEEDNREIFENPKRTLNDLKSLFEHNQIAFNKSDETRVLTAIYTQDKPVIRLYRELLFRRIAQKAIQSAENLFKQTNSLDRDGNQMCKLSLENKRLNAQNEALKNKLRAAEDKIKSNSESHQSERVRSAHKLFRVQEKAKYLA